MSNRHSLSSCLTTTAFTLLGLGLGYLTGSLFIGPYAPPWDRQAISIPPARVIEIVNFEIGSTLTDPSQDILFVRTENGKVFSNIVPQSDWEEVDTLPESVGNRYENCAESWDGPTDSPLWNPPPIDEPVLDSVGVIFERPVSIILRCYVLLENGSLEVWTHSGDGIDSVVRLFLRIVIALMGAVFVPLARLGYIRNKRSAPK